MRHAPAQFLPPYVYNFMRHAQSQCPTSYVMSHIPCDQCASCVMQHLSCHIPNGMHHFMRHAPSQRLTPYSSLIFDAECEAL